MYQVSTDYCCTAYRGHHGRASSHTSWMSLARGGVAGVCRCRRCGCGVQTPPCMPSLGHTSSALGGETDAAAPSSHSPPANDARKILEEKVIK